MPLGDYGPTGYFSRTPEEKQADADKLKHALYGLPIGALSQVLSPAEGGTGDKTQFSSWVPGIASLTYGGLTNLAQLGTNAVLKAGEYDQNTGEPIIDPATNQRIQAPQVGPLPGQEAAQKLNEASVRGAIATLPEYKPTTPEEQTAQDVGIGAAQGLTTVAPARAPGLLRAILPPAKLAPVGGALGAVAGAIQSPTGVESQDVPIPPPEKAPETPGQPLPMPPLPSMSEQPAAPLPMPPLPAMTEGKTTDNSGWSYLNYAEAAAIGAAGLWATAKFGPRVLNTVSDFIRGNLRTAEAGNLALASKIPGSATGLTKPLEMPLPGNASGMTRQWAEKAYNPNAVLNEYAKGTYGVGTPQAEASIAANEMINNPANANRRMEGLFRTGVEEGTGHVFPKMVDYKEAVAALTPGQRDNFSWAAWLKNELNIRSQNIEEAAKNGELWTPANDAKFRVNFNDMDTDTMRQSVQTLESDPQVKALLDQNKAIQSAIVDSAEQRGLVTKTQADYARKHYPDFMPTIDADGNYLHSWDGKIRDPNTGVNKPPAPAWEAMIQHFDRSIRGAQMNDWRRGWLLNQDAIQRADPHAAEIISERRVGGNTVARSTDRTITVQTSDGPRTFDINNTAVYRALQSNPQVMGMTGGIFNAVRRFYQNFTTGPGAMAFGHPFALTNFIRDTQLIPTQASPGAYRGYLDKLTGMRLPYDPTFIPGAAATAGKDMSSVLAKNFSDILASKSNPTAQFFRATFGDTQVDSWVNWMRAEFERSSLAQREAMGVGAGGNRSSVDMNNLITDQAGTLRDPTSRSVAPLINFNLIPSKVPLPNFIRETVNGLARGTAQSYVNLQQIARDLYGVISDAPHSFYHDINVGNPRFTPRTLANEVQQVTGNPGTRGTGLLTRGASMGVPYYNTSLQGLGRSLAAFRDNPLHVMATMGTVLSAIVVAEHLSALLSGPDHVDDLENRTTNSQKARNVIIYHGPGTDPNDHTEIPTAIEWQILKPIFSAVAGHALGTWQATKDPDMWSRLVHTLVGLHDDKVSTDVTKETMIGGINALPPMGASPIVDLAVGALTGQQVKDIPQQVGANFLTGNPLLSGMTTGGGPTHKVPGQEGTDGLMLRSDAGVLKAVISQLGAAGSVAFGLVNNYMERAKISPEWARRGLFEDYKQEWTDQTKFLNSVWRNNLPMSTFGSLEERTNQMWRNVAAAANVSSDIRGEGFTGIRRGTAVGMSGDSPVPQDPQMRNLYMTMAEQGKIISRGILPQENKIRAQMDDLKSSPFMPDERRRIGNDLSKQLYMLTSQKYQMLLDINAQLSKLAGGRHVDVGSKINWQGSVDQFDY